MDRITQSFLDEFVAEHEIDHLPQDTQFEHFASYVTVRRHYNGETFDTSDIVIGAGGDTAIDSITIMVNGSIVTDVENLEEHADVSGTFDVTFIFVQAERTSSFDGAKLSSFGFGVRDFFEPNPRLVRNEMVTSRAEIMDAIYKLAPKFRPGHPSCKLYYVTTGNWVGDQNLDVRRRAVMDDLRSMQIFRDDIEFTCLGAEGVQRLYRESKNTVAREFTFAAKTLMPEIAGVTEAYLGFIPLSEFLSIVRDENGDLLKSIFYDNVRDWQDYNAVNTEIKETLQSAHKARFVLMNNGITIIARKLTPLRRDRVQIEDFQIVNGCQTSHVLFDQQGFADDSVSVPLRLIATEDDAVINSIVRATNRQTKVEEDQFFALTEFAESLEDYFQTFPDQHKLYYERRSRQYARLQTTTSRVVTHGNLIRAVASMFLALPHQTTRSYKSLKESVGKEIFAKGHRLEPYYVAAFSLYRLENFFRTRIDPKLKPARFHILLAVRLLSNPASLPRMNSHEMERYCKVIMDDLWGPDTAEQLFMHAAAIVDESAQGNFHRDNIRTLPFTDRVIAGCNELVEPGETSQ